MTGFGSAYEGRRPLSLAYAYAGGEPFHAEGALPGSPQVQLAAALPGIIRMSPNTGADEGDILITDTFPRSWSPEWRTRELIKCVDDGWSKSGRPTPGRPDAGAGRRQPSAFSP